MTLAIYIILIWFAVVLLFLLYWSAFRYGETLWQLLGHIRLRRLLFGWICEKRGCHHSGGEAHKIEVIRSLEDDSVVGMMGTFRCLCGKEYETPIDTVRGGRIVVPFAWGDGR